MTIYSLTGKYTSAGFEDLRQNGAAELERRVTKHVNTLGGRVLHLYFAGANFDVYLVIEAPASVAAMLTFPMIASKAFLPGVELARLVTAEEADEAIASARSRSS